jgi:hypothetical protein
MTMPITGTGTGSSKDQHNHERIRVLYFVGPTGHVIIAPDSRHPCPRGYEPRYATTLREVDMLTDVLNRQDQSMFDRMMQKDREALYRKHTEIRRRLGNRLLEPDVHPNERLFIKSMYRYLDRKEEELLKCVVRGYFHQREYDSPGSDPVEAHGTQLKMPTLSARLSDILTK